MKILTQGWTFKNNAETQPKTTQVVLYITINKMLPHYAQYTNSIWGYFEGDNIDL